MATNVDESFILPDRYENLARMGQGGFGAVIKAKDRETQKTVAIKKLKDPFLTAVHAKRVYRELKLLMYLNHRDANIVRLYNIFTSDADFGSFQNLYLTLNFADYDLNRYITIRRKASQPFTENEIKHIIYSILRGLKYIHSAGIVHRDLKPANIGVTGKFNIYILDFGLARKLTIDPNTAYVVTRWWRAPEILISRGQYNENVDIWSVGCIMAQLICLQSIFNGTDTRHQLRQTFELIGKPDDTTLISMGCTSVILGYIHTLGEYPAQNFHERFAVEYNHSGARAQTQLPPEGITLLKRLLEFDPTQRPSAAAVIADPYFEALHDEDDEPTAEVLNDPYQGANHSISEWKNIIWQMIKEFKPPAWTTDDSSEDE